MMLEEMFSVVIVEPDILTRFTLKKMMEAIEGFQVIGDFECAEDAISFIDDNIVNLVIMDVNLPYLNGIEASNLIKNRYHSVKIVALTSYGSDSFIISSLLADADAYFIKDLDFNGLKSVVSNVLQGGCDVDLRIQYALFNCIQTLPKKQLSLFAQRLSFRESSFINLGLKGFSKNEILESLEFSINDIYIYVHSILEKLIDFTRSNNLLPEVVDYEV